MRKKKKDNSVSSNNQVSLVAIVAIVAIFSIMSVCLNQKNMIGYGILKQGFVEETLMEHDVFTEEAEEIDDDYDIDIDIDCVAVEGDKGTTYTCIEITTFEDGVQWIVVYTGCSEELTENSNACELCETRYQFTNDPNDNEELASQQKLC